MISTNLSKQLGMTVSSTNEGITKTSGIMKACQAAAMTDQVALGELKTKIDL